MVAPPECANNDESIAELRAQLAARDAFIATAAHELRNPMTPIAGQVSLLLRLVRGGNAAPERVAAGLERIEWLIERYVRRATTLLDVSRISTGKLSLELAPVHVASVVREVANALAPIAEHARSPIRLDVSDAAVALADRLAVEQIVDNLLSNALKYGAGKPIDVQVEQAHDSVVLRVRDHGIGIPEAECERIFGRFERLAGAGEHGSGFGVGLWIVRRLADAMGGGVAVDSTPGEGATFSVMLPGAAKDKA
jgi:two-component system, OmpR family, sensor kinase